ncbi:MAG: dihydrodipicolinate synthase family protein [Planctomycetes bacterium]|nr:dihydrodipicolinate synthase family protein [Planctomycetota bacterium]
MTSSAPDLISPLQGIIPPLVTPMRDRDTLDCEGLERLIEHVLAGGVHGLFILGTTGEAPSLSYRVRRELIDRVCQAVNGRVPVLVGITDTAFTESVHLAQHAAQAGARAVVLAAPYYFPAGQPELEEYVEHLLPELPLPLFLYNMPALTKVAYGLETIEHLMQHDAIVGLKDSSANMVYFKDVIHLTRSRKDWTLLMGPEELLVESLWAGGHGGVNGGANLWPSLFVDIYKAARCNDHQALEPLQEKAFVLRKLYRIGRHPSSLIKGIKCALSLLNICDDFIAEPFHHFREPERRRVQDVLEETGLL